MTSHVKMHSRRSLLRLIAAVPVLGIQGCASFWPCRKQEILAELPSGLNAVFQPAKINRAVGSPAHVIDVHAHFFNARDVPIRGYLAGPVAHSKGGVVGELLKALAPIAEWIGNTAPRAFDEFNELLTLAGSSSFTVMSEEERFRILDQRREKYLQELSGRLYEQLKAVPEFVRIYNETQGVARSRFRIQGVDASSLNETSLFKAMQRDLQSQAPDVELYGAEEPPPYADGVLAFVGYMLSYRWMNLVAYQRAYSTGDSAFGVDQVFGALVDFDHWLKPLPRTAHEDQIKLHQLLSQLSGGYMRPLVAYNPWSDVLDNGRTLARVLDALDKRGFVGVKIYPPNGFRPFGNTHSPNIPTTPGMPSTTDLDRVLLKLWDECSKRNVPVMAHTGNSMGSDDAHNEAAGPIGWQALITERGSTHPAKVNLGHFGGDSSHDNWNDELARMMATPEGAGLYGDLGYWDELRCRKGLATCAARQKLDKAVKENPVVGQRLMYGSDWLMLSQERRWDRYPFEILAALPDGVNLDAVFSSNAKHCFAALQS
ncbi:MAG: amidohydrolase family protein [Leptothrix ochracea]|uniref:amidohydrolase family protein n=1 Tax=Leptothrix ochracea TaxID=735331 RepID=UPI0034E2C8F3